MLVVSSMSEDSKASLYRVSAVYSNQSRGILVKGGYCVCLKCLIFWSIDMEIKSGEDSSILHFSSMFAISYGLYAT